MQGSLFFGLFQVAWEELSRAFVLNGILGGT